MRRKRAGLAKRCMRYPDTIAAGVWHPGRDAVTSDADHAALHAFLVLLPAFEQS
jgi:hypothetical protein